MWSVGRGGNSVGYGAGTLWFNPLSVLYFFNFSKSRQRRSTTSKTCFLSFKFAELSITNFFRNFIFSKFLFFFHVQPHQNFYGHFFSKKNSLKYLKVIVYGIEGVLVSFHDWLVANFGKFISRIRFKGSFSDVFLNIVLRKTETMTSNDVGILYLS